MSGRDKTAVLIKETLGWTYQQALQFKRTNHDKIATEAEKSGRPYMDVAVDLAEKKS